jgi:hypothetical protein
MAGSAAEVALLDGTYDEVGVQVDAERVRERLERYGYDDGGVALWSYTINLLRPYRSLITRVAIKLRRARVLDGAEIDRIVFRG